MTPKAVKTPEDVKPPEMPEAPRLFEPRKDGKIILQHKVYCEEHMHEFVLFADGQLQLLHHKDEDIDRQVGFNQLGGEVKGCFRVAAITRATLAANKGKLPSNLEEFFNNLVSEVAFFWQTADPESAKELFAAKT